MKKLFYFVSVATLLSSCTTTMKTAKTADISASLQSATVADLDVAPQRITYTMTPSKEVRRGGDANVKRAAESEALEKNGGGDVLVNPEFTVSKRRGLFGSKITSVTVSGRPASYTNIRSFNDTVWCNPVFRGIMASRKYADINPLMPEAFKEKHAKSSAEEKFKRTLWMIRLGFGGNRLGGEDNLEVSRRFGYSVGVEFNKTIGRRGGYWGMDFTFASRGYKAEDEYSHNYYNEQMRTHTIQWTPFTFGWKFKLGNSGLAIDPHVGFFTSFDMAGELERESAYRWNLYDTGNSYIGMTPNGTYTITNYVDEESAGTRFDVGLKFGVGLWYKNKYNIDFTIQRGFLEPFAYSYSDGGCLNLMCRFGYAF